MDGVVRYTWSLRRKKKDSAGRFAGKEVEARDEVFDLCADIGARVVV